MRDRLAKILQSIAYAGRTYDEFADNLLKSGVIVLPCKVWDTVYVIDTLDFEPCKKKGEGGDVCPHLYGEYGIGYSCLKTRWGYKQFECAEINAVKIADITQIFDYWDAFGKTVFLTREEAEKALARMKGERNER